MVAKKPNSKRNLDMAIRRMGEGASFGPHAICVRLFRALSRHVNGKNCMRNPHKTHAGRPFFGYFGKCRLSWGDVAFSRNPSPALILLFFGAEHCSRKQSAASSTRGANLFPAVAELLCMSALTSFQ